MLFDYPPDLARFLTAHWDRATRLPPENRLTELISCCYQASLLTEELHEVTFRVVLVEPNESQPAPPWGHLCLLFEESKPLQPGVLAKLAPVAEVSRSLVGLRLGENGYEIWGLVNSGSSWAASQYSRRRPAQPPARSLVVSVTGPGCLSIYHGCELIAHLSNGRIRGSRPEVLSSRWLEQVFQNVRQEWETLHAAACPSEQQVEIDAKITRTLAQSTLRRALDCLRLSGHGGSLLIVPADQALLLSEPNPYLNLNYRFVDSGPRRLYRELLTRVMGRLGQLFPEASRVHWEDYRSSRDSELNELDEAFESFSHMLAGLLAMDGAVLMSQSLELLAFGVEIAGNLPAVAQVEAALDIEAEDTRTEGTEGVGTRHRSVYRLCAQLPWLLALVQSQDGRIRMVKQHQGKVTYWDQFGVGSGINGP